MEFVIDTDRLRNLTDIALAQANEERRRREAEEREAEERKQLEIRAKARSILVQIPRRAEEDAIAGRKFSIVMSFSYGDYNRPRDEKRNHFCDPLWLTGATQIVYEHCVLAELHPTLEYWHDGAGVNEGFNIVIHW